ncbi:D-ribose pyranase [Planococcus beigongshangi]|uniref:D-ribose pyranase n=1 Tax=Planococcus beigongshangi TaxID=2782536 RepID=UPI00193B5037
MKKHGMINRDIAASLAEFGHTDHLVIADCGLPVPNGVRCIDLSYELGKPSFIDILDAVLADFQQEAAFIAKEIEQANPVIETKIKDRVTVSYMTHEELKQLSKDAKLIIRTGEASPYANIVLRSGVIF